jgi:DNA-binding MarR family transcriptional regulator
LRESHELSLAFFESLFLISRARGAACASVISLGALRVTVGGTRKLVDRVERAGLIAREPDPDDRRASRVVLTAAGKRKLPAAVKTYEEEVASIVGGVLSLEEQRQMSGQHVAAMMGGWAAPSTAAMPSTRACPPAR